MQPHILFPILIFAFGMGAFLITFIGDINSDDVEFFIKDNSSQERFLTKDEVLAEKSVNQQNSDNNRSWLNSFQKSFVTDYYYPVKDVSIRLSHNDKKSVKFYTLTTEYLEPYKNFCVNQVLNKTTNIQYKVIESGDKIKFKINSTNKKIIDSIAKEFEYYDIKAVVN